MKMIVCTLLWITTWSLQAQNSKTEQLVLKLSKEKNGYMNPGSLDKLKPILDERMIFIHSNGLTETKNEMIKNVTEGKWRLNKVDIHEANARVYKNNIVIIIGKGSFYATTAGNDIVTELYYTEVWSHVTKGWVLTSRHASKII